MVGLIPRSSRTLLLPGMCQGKVASRTMGGLPQLSACEEFRRLSDQVRLRLEQGVQVGLPFPETTVTDEILFQLKWDLGSRIVIRRFGAKAEGVTTGADWEWWIATGAGWHGMRVQAKRLVADSLRYTELRRRAGRSNQFQAEMLVRDAASRNLFPAYVFYNYWRDPRIQPHLWRRLAPPRHLLGCAIASAHLIWRLVTAGKDHLAQVAPLSAPWEELVCRRNGPNLGGSDPDVHSSLQILNGLGEGGVETPPRPVRELPDYASRALHSSADDTLQNVPETIDGILSIDLRSGMD